ncbi:MAG: hypothetical protein IKD72_02870 [Clostridia bacterium]|nr:hypothetical protein [Clostridia bacterium]
MRAKKCLSILLSLALLLGVCGLGSQTAFAQEDPCIAYEEDFESGTEGWTFTDADGDGYQWFYRLP